MPLASDIVSSRSFASPLLQVKGNLFGSIAQVSAPSSAYTAPPIPALDFNLFRTPSVYSTTSESSFSSTSSRDSSYTQHPDDDEFGSRAATPTTPKARVIELGRPIQPGSGSTPRRSDVEGGGQLTPKRSFVVASRAAPAPTSPTNQYSPVRLHQQAQPLIFELPKPQSRSRTLSNAEKPQHTPVPLSSLDAELASIHGEQGSEWGEDEANFEWIDTGVDAPEALNGMTENATGVHLSPTKGLGKFKAVVPGFNHEGRKLRKQLVFARRAPPPPALDALGAGPSSAPPARVPPPNILVPSQSNNLHPPAFRPLPTRHSSDPISEASFHHPQPRRPVPLRPASPTMIPLKTSSSQNLTVKKDLSRNSQLSFAYSFYDLDPSNPSTPRATTPSGEMMFPKGQYVKVSASSLGTEADREKSMSVPMSATTIVSRDGAETPRLSWERTAEDFVTAGIEARGKGDLPKSAYNFKQAAERGSVTGRMYWGLSLRHGWGVARDDKRAFTELRKACEDSLPQGGTGFQPSPEVAQLTTQQKKSMTKDLSLGMFEIANCFLEGVGVKKSPDVAVEYLRYAANLGDLASQEQLGSLLSKGSGGVKKDMKEAAKWYRMAIAQGSGNTFGLAWVWKDKYKE